MEAMEEIRVPTRAGAALEVVIGDRRSVAIAFVLIVFLAAGGVALASRAAPSKVAPPSTYASWSPDVVGPSAPVGQVVTVHVAGEVKLPGLYPLPAGSRFADAVAAAGGPTARADLDLMNLAQLLVDGTKVEVPRRTQSTAGTSIVAPAPASAAPAVISLNSADQAALETIPGIGPVTAAAILAHRDEIGGFTSLEQLLDVSGIGPATYESMRDFVSL